MFNFFGYGVYRDKQRLKDILGKDPKGGYGAVVSNYTLAIQTLNLIPEKPRTIIQQVWGNDFKAYTIKKGMGMVTGVVWELEDQDLQVLKDWEYDGVWREFKEIEITTFYQQKLSAITEKALDDAPINAVVDGLNYEDNINKQGKIAVENVNYKINETRKLLEKIK